MAPHEELRPWSRNSSARSSPRIPRPQKVQRWVIYFLLFLQFDRAAGSKSRWSRSPNHVRKQYQLTKGKKML
ncbi:hypothetical protein BD309DRAFT_945711 [Dichomitus squalens]|nr:hypothetical protein BD309DRAFT_945711 [Dichomitus squalens]